MLWSPLSESAVLLFSGVLTWNDVITESGAWDVFIWYGGLVKMAEALGETGITKRFADSAAGFTSGWTWWAALALLLLVYFYAHYGFASITAHATAMFIPFRNRDNRCRRSALSCSARACVLFESQCFVDSLWNNSGANLFWFGLRDSADMVANRLNSFACNNSNLGNFRIRVVEAFRTLVAEGKQMILESANSGSLRQRLAV